MYMNSAAEVNWKKINLPHNCDDYGGARQLLHGNLHGMGGSVDCKGLRIFDVAVNGTLCIDDLDIWAEVGTDTACKKVVNTTVEGGGLEITFPEVKAGQALVSAIAIASLDETTKPAPPSPAKGWSWENIPEVVKTPKSELPEGTAARPKMSYPARDALLKGQPAKTVLVKKKEGLCFGEGLDNSTEWDISVGLANVYALRFWYMNTTDQPISVTLEVEDSKGEILKSGTITFPEAPKKWRIINTTTERYINAGTYKIRLKAPKMTGLCFHALDVQ